MNDVSMIRLYLSVLALAVFSAGAAAQPFPMNEQGDVRWVCAGIGETEREALAKMEPDSKASARR
jgi:hypothetical protein